MLAVSGFDLESPNHHIFMTEGLTTPFRCVTQSFDTPCVAPLWSPTRKQLAFTALNTTVYGSNQLYTVDSSNDALEPISAARPSLYGQAWLPDGRSLALFEIDGEDWFLSVLDPVTRHIQRLLSIRTIVYTWSPDWTRLAISPARDDPQLYLSDLSGTNRQPITDQLPHVSRIDWSPDGQQLACTMVHDAGTDLYVLGCDGKNLRKVADLRYESPVVWSPSSATIAYVMDTPTGTTVATVDVATGQRTPLLPMHPDDPGEMVPTNPVWMQRGGSFLVSSFVGDRCRVFQVDVDGSGAQDVTPPDAPEYMYDLAWGDPGGEAAPS
jgi:Tol biopolymer transport system component